MAFRADFTDIPSGIPKFASMPGSTYTGMAPLTISAFMALRWTFLGMIIFSPSLHAYRIMAWTADVVPLTIKKAFFAPKASAASF